MVISQMLDIRDINVSYGSSQVLFDLSLSLEAGTVTTLLGRNGMGKTTCIHSVMGILPVKSGSVTFQNEAINNLPAFRVAQSGIGLVPEGRQIFPNLSVRENLIATARSENIEIGKLWNLESVLAFFPKLSERLDNMGNQLSGGEQQMLAIGRALMLNPKLLILDEATEGLAPLIREEIWQRLHELKKMGLTILIVDKNIDALTRIADRHYIIEKGRNVWHGDSEALRESADVRHKYLGV
ncbi:MAG: ABC transporter ATP-binding protein [Pseudomonadota bacterium]